MQLDTLYWICYTYNVLIRYFVLVNYEVVFMFARLFKKGDEVIVAYEAGDIVSLDEAGVKDFFLNADTLVRKNAIKHPTLKILNMTQSTGQTLAYVDDQYNLVITDLPYYRRIMAKPIEYLTAEEYGELHGKKRGIIMRLCRDRRLLGAIKKGEMWLIPKDTPYPKDARVGSRIEPLY